MRRTKTVERQLLQRARAGDETAFEALVRPYREPLYWRAVKAVDTTGAGDLYAAGVLFGLSRGAAPDHAARLGSIAAAEVISHLGARPQMDLVAVAKSILG